MFCCSPTEFQGQDPNPGVASSWGYDSVLPASRPARECGERIPFLSELRTRRKGVIFGSLAYKSRSWAFQQQWRPPRQRVTGKLHSLPLALAPTISIYMEWQGIWSDYSLCLWLMHLAAIFFFFLMLCHTCKRVLSKVKLALKNKGSSCGTLKLELGTHLGEKHISFELRTGIGHRTSQSEPAEPSRPGGCDKATVA